MISAWLAQAIGSGTGVFLAVEAAKRLKAIPVNEGQTTRLRATAGLLAAAAVLLEGMASGNLMPDNLQQLALALLTFGGAWATAHSGHKARKMISGLLGRGEA